MKERAWQQGKVATKAGQGRRVDRRQRQIAILERQSHMVSIVVIRIGMGATASYRSRSARATGKPLLPPASACARCWAQQLKSILSYRIVSIWIWLPACYTFSYVLSIWIWTIFHTPASSRCPGDLHRIDYGSYSLIVSTTNINADADLFWERNTIS